MLIDVNSFKASTHLGIKSNTEYSVAKQKLKDYFAITKTNEEIRENFDLRFQEDDSLCPIVGARVFINYNSAIVPVALINLTNQSVVIQKNKVLADDLPARLVGNELAINKQAPPATSQVAAASAVTAMMLAQRLTQVE